MDFINPVTGLPTAHVSRVKFAIARLLRKATYYRELWDQLESEGWSFANPLVGNLETDLEAMHADYNWEGIEPAPTDWWDNDFRGHRIPLGYPEAPPLEGLPLDYFRKIRFYRLHDVGVTSLSNWRTRFVFPHRKHADGVEIGGTEDLPSGLSIGGNIILAACAWQLRTALMLRNVFCLDNRGRPAIEEL